MIIIFLPDPFYSLPDYLQKFPDDCYHTTALFLQEMERRIQNNPSNSALLAVMLDFETGARKGEVLSLSESDIIDDYIHIHRQGVE